MPTILVWDEKSLTELRKHNLDMWESSEPFDCVRLESGDHISVFDLGDLLFEEVVEVVIVSVWFNVEAQYSGNVVITQWASIRLGFDNEGDDNATDI